MATQELLAKLRQAFSQRIPGGLQPEDDVKLQEFVRFHTSELLQGRGGGMGIPGYSGSNHTQEILRRSYDSMAAWLQKQVYESEIDPDTLFASIPPPTRPTVQQKDVLQPQEDVVKYREVEYNLVVRSQDRNWLVNTSENRYNFSVSFSQRTDQGQNVGLHPTVRNRLRNISRIEFIKAILPVEGLTVIVPRVCPAPATPTNPVQNAFYSVLALPSVTVVVDELQGNNYGTDQEIDKALAVCQYDAVWRSDYVYNNRELGRGYSLFIPKFMKAQRVYSPAPLANLSNLSFRLEDPENNVLSSLPDSSVVSHLAFSQDVSGSCYTNDPSGNYIFVQTSSWFPVWSYSQMDHILFKGLAFDGAPFPSGTTESTDLLTWLQNDTGHPVVGVAYTSGSPSTPYIYEVTDGANDAGYANWVVIRNRFADPSTGDTNLLVFSTDPTFHTSVANTAIVSGGILNLNRQTQLYLRIVTREYDATSSVRSDNVR